MPSPTPSEPRNCPCQLLHRRYGRRSSARTACPRPHNFRERSMYNFTFHRPTTVRQAAGLLTRNPDAKILAGGHSLLPVMKQRLAQPSALIDLSLVEGLSGVEQKGRSIVIGAMSRHADVAVSSVLQQGLPGLATVAASVRAPQGGNRGTHRAPAYDNE